MNASKPKVQAIRVSLGCRDLSDIDSELILTFGKRVTWLDLSNNRFGDDLLVLRSFPVLGVLVLDGNNVTSYLKLPPLPKLHTLWMNNNQVDNTTVLLDHLVQVTPNLEEVSLLKNPACLNYFMGGTPKEYRDYRLYVINRLTNIHTLDGTPVTEEEYSESTKMYGSLPHTRAPKKTSQTVNTPAKTFQDSVEYSVASKTLNLSKLSEAPDNNNNANSTNNLPSPVKKETATGNKTNPAKKEPTTGSKSIPAKKESATGRKSTTAKKEAPASSSKPAKKEVVKPKKMSNLLFDVSVPAFN